MRSTKKVGWGVTHDYEYDRVEDVDVCDLEMYDSEQEAIDAINDYHDGDEEGESCLVRVEMTELKTVKNGVVELVNED